MPDQSRPLAAQYDGILFLLVAYNPGQKPEVEMNSIPLTWEYNPAPTFWNQFRRAILSQVAECTQNKFAPKVIPYN